MPLPSLTRYLLGLATVFLATGFFATSAQAGLIIQAPKYVGLEKGLVGFWSFDGKTIAGVHAYDTSGNGNRGVLTSGPVPAAGKIGQGLEFDGVNDFVSGTGPNLANSPFSVSAWVRPESFSNEAYYALGSTPATRESLHLRIESSTSVRFGLFGDDLTATLTDLRGRWSHLVVTFTSGGVRTIYQDGVYKNSDTAGGMFIGNTSQLIGDDFTADTFFNGLIDDVRIYNRALSADEVKRLYKIGATAKINTSLDGPQSGLVGHWSFDGTDMAGTRAFDRSGQGKHGTLNSGATPVAGKIGQGVQLDGTDDYVSVGNAGSGIKTISFWVKPNLSAASQVPQATSFPTAGTSTWTVPTGVTSITVKAWGAGGGGGGNDNANSGGGDGGGGGYSTATVNVTAGTQVTVRVGLKGFGGLGTGTTDAGGGGGGYSSATTSSADYVIAGGGGGGGAGADANGEFGGDGGAGGGTTGVDGGDGADTAGAIGNNGAGGGSSGGGAGGTGGTGSDGETGETDGRHEGGDAGANNGEGTQGGGGSGGSIGGGDGGASLNGGGGGGAGYYGGGGGEAGNGEGGGGGGGGSSYTNGGSTSAGSGTTPGSDSDTDRATYCSSAGTGGAGGADGGNPGSNGNDGCVVITWNEGAAAVDDFKLIDIDGTDQIEIIDNAIAATSFPAATVYVDGVKGTTVDGQWHHVVIVDTTGVNASAMDIGRVSSSYLKGLIDDVRIYNRVLSQDEINRLYKNGATVKVGISQANGSLGNGLVGWWTFDGKHMAGNSTAGEYAVDVSGNGNRGTLTNGPVRVAGKIGQGMQFDGVNDYVGMRDVLDPLTDDYTISAWIKPSSTAAGPYPLISKENAGDSDRFYLAINLEKLQVLWRVDGTTYISESRFDTVLNEGNWYHVVVTFDRDSVATAYIDGVKEPTTYDISGSNGLTFNNSRALVVGGRFEGTSQWFPGLLDDVRIYNRALTPDEIKRLYNMGR